MTSTHCLKTGLNPSFHYDHLSSALRSSVLELKNRNWVLGRGRRLYRKLFFAVTLLGPLLEAHAQPFEPMTVEGLCRLLRTSQVWGVRSYKEFPAQLAVSGTTTFAPSDIDTLFWAVGTDAATKGNLLAMDSLRIKKSTEDWTPKTTNPSGYHFDAPYFINVNNLGATWVTSAHKMMVPGLAKYKNTAIKAPPVATPNHFSPRIGWTWVYDYTRNSSDRQFSSSNSVKLWLTLKTYRESGPQFSSTWSVSLSSRSTSAHLLPPESSSESNYSWADTNVTVNGAIDSGLHFDDFLPQAAKTGQKTPPLFLNHCKLPAIMSENPSSGFNASGFTTIANTFKPPYYVYWQFANSEVEAAAYKDSVGLVALTTVIQLEGSYSMKLSLTYFGTNPPERPVNIGQRAASQRARSAKESVLRGHGSFKAQHRNPNRRDENFIDGLGREHP